jgi:hypothetical protein
VVDAPRNIVEHDSDGRTVLDGLETVLGKQRSQRDLALDDERHRAACLQGTIADRCRYEHCITMGGRTYRRL